MTAFSTSLEDLILFKPNVSYDTRGWFLEAYNLSHLREAGLKSIFLQENQAYSLKGVLRGLHFQIPPMAQGKLVRCVFGSILDVAVDLRPHSQTYGHHYKVVLSHENNFQLWIPAGFAHGVLTQSEFSLMAYFCTEYYSQDNARAIVYNDPDLGIDWGCNNIICNDRDLNAPSFSEFNFNEIWG